MKDKTKVKDQISFVLNGEPIVRPEKTPEQKTHDRRREVRERMEYLQRRKKIQEQND